jgi:2-polyprenyl-6-methoxyphenol hydroxylase-like FAD-dependent oxidoreductase
VNWVAELATDSGTAPPERGWKRRADRAVFALPFVGWRFDWLDVPALIAGVAEVFEFPMSDRDPVERRSFSRVTLLGDAAHSMYPIGSNGASQAILDAAALSEALAGVDDVPAALRESEARRLGPTAAVGRSNREMGPVVIMQMAEERAPLTSIGRRASSVRASWKRSPAGTTS